MPFAIMPELKEPIVCEEPCQHRDCAEWRATAAKPCEVCNQPVKAGEKFIYSGDGIAHWFCAGV